MVFNLISDVNFKFNRHIMLLKYLNAWKAYQISNLSDACECGSCEEVVRDKTGVGCGNTVQQYTSTCELGQRSSRSTSGSRLGQRRCGHLHWIQPLTDTSTLHTHYLPSTHAACACVFAKKSARMYFVTDRDFQFTWWRIVELNAFSDVWALYSCLDPLLHATDEHFVDERRAERIYQFWVILRKPLVVFHKTLSTVFNVIISARFCDKQLRFECLSYTWYEMP